MKSIETLEKQKSSKNYESVENARLKQQINLMKQKETSLLKKESILKLELKKEREKNKVLEIKNKINTKISKTSVKDFSVDSIDYSRKSFGSVKSVKKNFKSIIGEKLPQNNSYSRKVPYTNKIFNQSRSSSVVSGRHSASKTGYMVSSRNDSLSKIKKKLDVVKNKKTELFKNINKNHPTDLNKELTGKARIDQIRSKYCLDC